MIFNGNEADGNMIRHMELQRRDTPIQDEIERRMTDHLRRLTEDARKALIDSPTLFQVRPTSLRDKLRYTDDAKLRAHYDAVGKLLEAEMGGREAAVDELIRWNTNFLLYGNPDGPR